MLSLFGKHFKVWVRVWGLVTGALFAVILVGGFITEWLIPNERLAQQSYGLLHITKEAMLYRATPERVAQKVAETVEAPTGFSPATAEEPSVVVLPEKKGFTGLGGRWIVSMKVGKDGRCNQAWLEMQPVGYP